VSDRAAGDGPQEGGGSRPPPSRSVVETVLLVTGVLLLAALAFAIQEILSPFIITGGLVFLLFPLRHYPLVRRLTWLAVLLFVLWFLWSILGLLVPFLIAFLIAYILNPVVTRFERRRVPRWVTSLWLVVLTVGIAITGAIFLMPLVLSQFQSILEVVRLITQDVVEFLNSGEIFRVLARYGVPVADLQQTLREQLSPGLEGVLRGLIEGVFGVVTSLSTVLLQVINVIIIPFLVFYLLKDFPVIVTGALSAIPERHRERAAAFGTLVDTLLGKYFRGMVLVALVQGLITSLGLLVIGVRYSLVLGIMTGLLTLVPYVGLIVSLVVSFVVALFSDPPIAAKAVAVVLLFVSQKLLQATVLEPRIIGSQVGLHPVLLILCLLVFGHFLGFVGMLIAVPATALLIAGTREWRRINGMLPSSS
jgi:predicted PurR-regulated permease PerM